MTAHTSDQIVGWICILGACLICILAAVWILSGVLINALCAIEERAETRAAEEDADWQDHVASALAAAEADATRSIRDTPAGQRILSAIAAGEAQRLADEWRQINERGWTA